MKTRWNSPWLGLVLALALPLDDCGGGYSDTGTGYTTTTPGPFVPNTAGLTRVSSTSPYAAGCDASSSTATNYLSAEVEPMVAVNPANPQNLFASWQQDRWTDGGSHALGGAVSFDGGASWSPRSTTFSRCSGGMSGNGGDYERASDPWISFGPDGHAYWMALTFSLNPSAMLVSRSLDGGNTWAAPQTLIYDASGFLNDKNAITADPTDAHYVYAVWDRINFTVSYAYGPSYLARSIDGGASWETARVIYDPGPNYQTLGNEVVVMPDGTVLDFFDELYEPSDPNIPSTATLRLIRSTDHGATWSAPITVADMEPLGARDPESGRGIRDGSLIARPAVAPSGTVYVTWQDSRFSAGARDGVALATSVDGGQNWALPVQVNAVHTTQAFTPSIAVSSGGVIGVTYTDLRNNDAQSTVLTDTWLATSSDGINWSERHLAGSFDLGTAPIVSGYFFIGDYQALASSGTDFHHLFAQTTGSTSNRTDIYTLQVPSTGAATGAKALSAYRALEAPSGPLPLEARLRVSDRVDLERHRPPARNSRAMRDD